MHNSWKRAKWTSGISYYLTYGSRYKQEDCYCSKTFTVAVDYKPAKYCNRWLHTLKWALMSAKMSGNQKALRKSVRDWQSDRLSNCYHLINYSQQTCLLYLMNEFVRQPESLWMLKTWHDWHILYMCVNHPLLSDQQSSFTQWVASGIL